MLSRLALRNFQVLPAAVRGIQTTTSTTVASSADSSRGPRPVRLSQPGPVKYGFIPAEWFTFFYPKTGVSGPYVFIGSFGTYLLSKEWYILEHEFYNALSFIAIWIFIVKKFGPKVAAYADKEIAEQEQEALQSRKDELQALEDGIAAIEKEKLRADGSTMILDIKKENVFIQLEAAYRERVANLYNEVKKRLDYQVQLDLIQRRIAQKQMAQWIIDSVTKSVTPDLEKQTLQQCIVDLQALSKS